MKIRVRAKTLFFIILILILSFPAIKTLLTPGFFETHDGKFHFVRLFHFSQSLKEGHFPVRWAERMNDRYGYPLFNFNYPLVYYLGSLIHFLGFGFGDSLKIIIFLSFVLSGIFTYLWIRNLFGNLAGFLAAIFYIYAPYRFVSSYVSGRMGEVTAYITIPLCFYTLTRFAKNLKFFNLALASLAYALLILSYNVSALIFSPLILSYIFFLLFLERKWSKKTLLKLMLFIILSLSLAAFFWIPALFEKKYVRLSHLAIYDYRQNFPTLSSYLYHPWGYGLETTGVPGGISHQIGLAQIMVIFLGFGFFLLQIYLGSKREKENLLALFFLFWFVLVFCMMNKFSQPLWEVIPLIQTVQFPFRFLSMVIFIASFFAGYLIYQLKNKKTLLLAFYFLLLALVLYANRNHLKPGFLERYPDSFYFADSYIMHHTTDVAGENKPIWNKVELLSYWEKIEQEETRGKISQVELKPRFYQFQSKSDKPMKIKINTFYFPGWQVLIDGRKANIDYQNKEGLIKFIIPSGKHQIIAKFEDTPLRKMSNLLSLGSIFITLFLILKPVLKKLKLAQRNLSK